MRSIAWATTIILLATPEAIKTPGLQMSLAACISLIASFEFLQTYSDKIKKHGFINRILFYVITITISTVIAGVATSFFVIYHFNQFSTYSVLANIVAIPLADFFIMPLGILSIILMPLGLEPITLKILEPGIEFLLNYSAFISSLPAANFYIPSFSTMGIIVISIGGLLLTLLKTKLKYIGILVLALGAFTIKDQAMPDLIIGAEGKVFAILQNDTMYLSHKNKAKFMVRTWKEKLGIKNAELLTQLKNPICSSKICCLTKFEQNILIVNDRDAPIDCANLHMLVNLTDQDLSSRCADVKYILEDDFKKLGTHLFYFKQNSIEIKTAHPHQTIKRAWERF